MGDVVLNVRVLILHDDGSWFAQGVEVDYGTQAKSLDHVKRRFEEGLAATVKEHLRGFGTIDALVEPAPEEISTAMQRTERAFGALAQRSPDLVRLGHSPTGTVIAGSFTYSQYLPVIGTPRTDKDELGWHYNVFLTPYLVMHVLRQHGVTTEIENPPRPGDFPWPPLRVTLIRGWRIETQFMPFEVHKNLLSRLGRRFGVSPDAFYEEAQAGLERAHQQLIEEGEIDE